jgi:hypothetical protein
MLKKILIGVAVVLVGLMCVIALQPNEYRVERTKAIDAPAEVVFAQIDDFRRWEKWSPWEHLDPNMKKTYSGPEHQVGASYAWQGNQDVGSGSMTVVEREAPTQLVVRLEFIEPFASLARNGFSLFGANDSTQVTWWMEGDNDFMGKAFGLFMNMDKMIGADFERGLDALKSVAEAEAAEQRKMKAAATAVAPVAPANEAGAPAVAPVAQPAPTPAP